ncbi:Rne/Rng family ribonuclease [Xylanimonas oleitrophica]|uniref:Rne/Rng family ribonuclease n=1 Tax=Xylanimonas oleitrophica TaxID=2607479 RepID=UPI001FE448C0|nr:Rne/Rng family ribonuclease [Xylanimonas oleitrophica]
MTSDSTHDATDAEGTASRKPARRRATRAAGGPVATPAPDLGITLPSRDEAPVSGTADPAAVAPAPVAEPAPAAPARRSRRASRPTSTPAPAEGLSLDDILLPERPAPAAEAPPVKVTAGRSSGTGSRRAVRSLDDIVLPGGDDDAAQPAEQAAAPAEEAPKKASRSRRARTEKPAEPVAAEPAAAETPEPVAPAAADAEPAPAAADAAPKKATRSRRKKPETAGAAVAPEPAVAAAAEQAEKPAETPAATAPGSTTPRLATTAMLFQAPDLSASRRPRRAQAPAGPPRPHDDDAAEAQQTQTEAAEPAAETAEAPAQGGRRSSRRGRGKSGEAPARAQEKVVEPGTSTEETAEQPAVAALTDDDVAAAEEVAAIEAELVADGVELVDLAPEDLLEEAADAEIEQADDRPRRRRRRGGRGRRGGRRGDGSDEQGDEVSDEQDDEGDEPEDADQQEDAVEDGTDEHGDDESGSSRRRRRRRRGSRAERAESSRPRERDEVTALKGSTRLEAKRQRRREGRDAGRRRQIITEAEFLARRESVSRSMIVREKNGRTQIAVLEDGVLVEHYVSQQSQSSMVGNVYLGRVQNVLPSMEAAFVDVGKGRNAVLYAGEVNWDAAGLDGGQPRRIEQALKSGDSVLVQVTKDPIGHKGARLTSQITLAGRYLVFVPGGGMTGISRKLPDVERNRLKKILRDVVPEGAGVIVRTAAEGASEEELRADVQRLESQWTAITTKAEKSSTSAPALLQGEPDLAIRVVRDIFNDDFSSLVVQGDGAWQEISSYVEELAPDLRERVSKWVENGDVFAANRVDEQLAKGMDRKVWLPSGGSLVIDRTEAMTVIDVNTGKFTGAGGTLEETVTRNNLEAAEEIVRQLRLRDIGGIIVIDFIDMVLESNRDLVLRRLVECLGRDRTKHQVAEVTSLGLVQMTRKRVGQGLVEAFSETCEHCKGRGFVVHAEPVEKGGNHHHGEPVEAEGESKRSRRKRAKQSEATPHADVPKLPEDRSEAREAVKATLATIAAAAAHAHDHKDDDVAAPVGAEHEVASEEATEAPRSAADETDVAADPAAEAPTEPADA